VRLGGQLLWQRNIGDSAFPSSATNSSTFDPVTGQVTTAPAFNPAAVPVVWRFNYNTALLHSFQNDYAANFTPTETSTLQAVAGWAFNRNHNTPSRTGTSPMPSVNLFTHEGEFAPKPAYNTFTFTNRSEAHATQKQAYALVKAGLFSERAFLTGGITRTWVNSAQDTLNPSTNALISTVRLDDNRDNYIGSLLVKPLKDVAVYYTYSTNANLVTFNSGNGVAQPLWSEGKQHEYGVKWEFLNKRLAANFAYFDMTQTNVTSPNPLANVNPGAAGNILSDNSSKGWELSLVGGLTKNLSVIASYTSLEYRDAFDRRVRNVADKMAGALIRYSVTEGMFKDLSVFVALSHFGEAPGETITGFAPLAPGATARVPGQPGFYTAAWTVYNAGAAYKVDERWSLNLNIDNITDKKFGWQPASRLTVSPYPGLTWRLTATVKL
jgi:iron complex outermembrane receptor protein